MLSGPGLVTTFLYYFVFSAVLGCFVTAQALGLSYQDATAVQIGLFMGILAGGVGAFFNRTVTLKLPIPKTKKDRRVFEDELQAQLGRLRFEPQAEAVEGEAGAGAIAIYQRAGSGSLFSGRLYLDFGDGEQVHIRGRAKIIRQLKRAME
jgi:hypothetical protein